MATRSYNGQLYQSATTELKFVTAEGFDWTWKTWEDAKFKIGRKKKIVNDQDGTVGGFTAEVVTTDSSMKVRKDEWDAFVDAFQDYYDDAELDEVLFTASVAYGNTTQKVRKDSAEVLLQEVNRDLPKSQDPLMVDLPMLMLSFTENGVKRFAKKQ
jgi:hypothetical protein